MAILAECDICGNQHRVKDDLVGNSIRCKDCGVLFVVPQGPAISPETFVEESGRLRRREQFRTKNLPARAVAGLITSLVIVMLTGIIWVTVTLVAPIPNGDLKLNELTPKAGCNGQSQPCTGSGIQQ